MDNKLIKTEKELDRKQWYFDTWNRDDFFRELEHEDSMMSTDLSIRKPTIREQLIEKDLYEKGATEEELLEFREHFWKTDDEILELSDKQYVKKHFEGFLNDDDKNTLDKFLIMTYRNNLWYMLSWENLLS